MTPRAHTAEELQRGWNSIETPYRSLLSPKIKSSSAKTGLSRVLFSEINSPDMLNKHSDGTEDAVMQNNILAIFAIFGS
jgi:hypothetical protein